MRVCLSHLRQSIARGGTERYLNQLAEFLCERGHDVTLLCRSHDELPHPAMRVVPLRGLAIGPAWRRWAFANAVERHLAGNTYDAVLGLGRTWSQDIIHIGGGCYEMHLEHMGITRPRPTDRVALAIERRALRPGAYRRVMVNSHMVGRDVMARYPVPAERLSVIHHGVDTQQFTPAFREQGAALRRSLGYAPDDFVFLFLASGFRRKGLDLLLDAFPAVAQKNPRARLLVVGQDSATPRYEAQATRLGVAARVHFAGRRGDAQICYAAADAYVLPTRYDAFGLTVLEALATGLPVITTTACGAAELLEDGVQGSVVNLAGDIATLSEALVLWCDRERARGAASAARALAEAHALRGNLEAVEALLLAVAEERRSGVANKRAR